MAAQWIAARRNFLFQVKALSRWSSAASSSSASDQAFTQRATAVPRPMPLPSPNPLLSLPCFTHCARSTGWSMPKVLSRLPEKVLDYLGRYTHRVALSNNRSSQFWPKMAQVTFTYRDRKAWRRTESNDASKLTSSSAASCCTSCPMASCAFVTLAFSPTARANTSSTAAENC